MVFALGCTAMNDAGFDSDAWKAQRGVGARENTRATLVPALSRSLRKGMTREEVRQLLGEPDARTEKADIYRMGIAPFGIDQESYQILYDAQGSLTEHRLSRG